MLLVADSVVVKVKIRNRLGMHARPAMEFVETASGFGCEISVCRGDAPDEKVDGKSIMQVMMLAATQGTELVIEAAGADAKAACDRLVRLVESGFDEE